MFRFVFALSVLCLVASGSPTFDDDDDRIFNGRSASIEEFPYQVSLQVNGNHNCGGSILTPYFVLTACHCVIDNCQSGNVNGLTIRAGSTVWSSGGDYVNAKQVFCHPNYDRSTLMYDVGLVKLARPFVYSDVIKPVTLTKSQLPSGVPVVVSGWGKFNDQIDELPSIIQAATLTSLSPQECDAKNHGYGPGPAISDTMICAMGPEKDTCRGDSGGPLVMENSRVQVGIVSWGTRCTLPNPRGVYCDLSNPGVVSFITQFVGPL